MSGTFADAVRDAVPVVRAVFALVTVLAVPGVLLLLLAGHQRSWPLRLAAALALSLAFWPTLLLWLGTLGLHWTAEGLRWMALAGWSALLASIVRERWVISRSRANTAPTSRIARTRHAGIPSFARRLFAGAGLALFLLAAALRIDDAKGLVAAPWVDGLHHTLITQLIRDGGRLPTSYRPYLDVNGFFYHFGFHATAAAAADLAGQDTRVAVLVLGQALSALAVLAQLALGYRLTGHRLAALAGAAVPAALFWFPAYFVSWARFTQLAGLVMLPGAWLLASDAASARRSWIHPRLGLLLAGFAAAGLLLTHYRVTAYFGAGLLILALVYLGRHRPRGTPGVRTVWRLIVAGIIATLLTGPWLVRAFLPGLLHLSQGSSSWYVGPNPEAVGDLPPWLFTTYLNRPLLVLATAGLALALARRRWGAFATAAILALVVLAANPAWIGLPSNWFLPPFALAISAYMPVGLGISFLVVELVGLLANLIARGVVAGRRAEAARLGILVGSIGVVAVAGWFGAKRPTVLNAATVLLTQADLEAAGWIRTHTDPSTRFLVSTAGWNLGAFRGLDGGYWLPVTAGRFASVPPALYFYGTTEYAEGVAELGRLVAKGDTMTDNELRNALELAHAEYVYLGPASSGDASKLSAERLDRAPFLARVYDAKGVVIWRCAVCRREGDRGRSGLPK